MQIIGELNNTSVFVLKAGDIGRLYQKSHFGKIIKGNILELDLLEALFLQGEQKIRIFKNKKEVFFPEIVLIAAQCIPSFETKYLLFKDLRSRGLAIKTSDTKEFAFHQFIQTKNNDPTQEKKCNIAVFSERDNFDIEKTLEMIKESEKKHAHLWFGIVDEEGDITYYDVSKINPTGIITEHSFPKLKGVLFTNRVVIFNQKHAQLLQKEEFFGKPFGDGLQLSLVEALHLIERGCLEIQTKTSTIIPLKIITKQFIDLQPDIILRLMVFKDLKQHGLLVKTGFKFGTHFRAYTKKPDATHAEYLVQVVQHGFISVWSEVSRAVRLAHSVNKEILLACIDQNTIEYIRFGRLRP
jgi:tRNA-intron endonuclease, archaea type